MVERDFRYLRDQHTAEGARAIFEKICTQLLIARHGDSTHSIRPSQGDEGIDILVGDFNTPIENYQCKFFVDRIDDAQKTQIRNSFDRAITSQEYKMKKWILCVPCELSVKEFSWWSDWKSRMEELHRVPLSLYQGSYLIEQLKNYNLYNSIFDNDIKNELDEILLYLTDEKRRIYNEILISMKEIDEIYYDDTIFVKKLKNAHILEIDGCKRDFYHAEFAEQAIISKGDDNELKILKNIKIKIFSFWETQYRRYQHESDGNDLLTRVYERIEDSDTAALHTNLSEINLLAKKGMLHQLADECSIGWLKGYEEKLKHFLAEERENNA